MSKPIIYYFPIRGRAEVARLALSLANVDWEEQAPKNFKDNLDEYPFEQTPRYVDGDMDLVQSNTILRFIAKNYKLFGANEKEEFTADMIMEGVESLRNKYVALIYQSQLAEDAKKQYYETHVSKSFTGRNSGAHFKYLNHFLEKSGTGFMVGSKPSIADLAVWDIFDLHQRIFKDQIMTEYPALAKHYEAIAGLPGIKEYLASAKRPQQPNGNGLG